MNPHGIVLRCAGFVVAATICGCGDMSTLPEAAKVPTIEFQLDGATSGLSGLSWPISDDGSPSEVMAIEEPHLLLMHLPDGKAFRTYSRVTILEQRAGTIYLAIVSPLECAVAYQEAVLELSRIGQILQIHSMPSFAKWFQNASALQLTDLTDRTSVSVDLGSGVNMYAEVKGSLSASGWFVSLEFTVERHLAGRDVK